MKKSRKRNGLLAAAVLVGGVLYGLSGRETSRELVEHEVNRHIPVRVMVGGLDHDIETNPLPDWRISWAERKVYRLNRFLAKPLYEVVVDQSGELEECRIISRGNKTLALLPGVLLTQSDIPTGRYITPNPEDYSFRNLFNPEDTGYNRIK